MSENSIDLALVEDLATENIELKKQVREFENRFNKLQKLCKNIKNLNNRHFWTQLTQIITNKYN